MTEGERIAILETRFSQIQQTMAEHIINDANQHAELKVSISETNTKLDDLLKLKAQGMGAIWFASLILGSGLLGVIALVWNAFR